VVDIAIGGCSVLHFNNIFIDYEEIKLLYKTHVHNEVLPSNKPRTQAFFIYFE